MKEEERTSKNMGQKEIYKTWIIQDYKSHSTYRSSIWGCHSGEELCNTDYNNN